MLAVGLALPIAALAADPRFPDWPCAQIKVPEISVAAVWAGPAIDDAGDAWQQDAAVKDNVARLAARRTSLDDAQKTIAELISGDAAERQQKAKLLFAGLYKTLNDERTEVMNGIERFFRQHKAFAEKIRTETMELRNLHDALFATRPRLTSSSTGSNGTPASSRSAQDHRLRLQVPVLIEQRLFALARAIQQSLE
jgi:hypothetical protein